VAKHDIWEKEKDLENTKKAVTTFKGRLSVEVRRQEKLVLQLKDLRVDQ